MENHDIEDMAEKVAARVTHRIFMILGTDIDKSEDLQALQKDFAHARAWRESIETIRTKGLATAVAFVVTGLLGYLLLLFNNR